MNNMEKKINELITIFSNENTMKYYCTDASGVVCILKEILDAKNGFVEVKKEQLYFMQNDWKTIKKDGYPKHTHPVLLTVENRYINITFLAIGWFSQTERKWIISGNAPSSRVIAWMEAPKKYQSEE